MSVFSSKVSITQYNVQGKLNSQIIEAVADGLSKHTIFDIDQQILDKAVGWTSFEKPFQPDFKGSSFIYGNYFVFSLRIDKKNIAAKLIKKYYAIEAARRMSDSGRDFLSKTEKKLVKDHVHNQLCLQIPATPNIYNVVWNFEASSLWFFSNLKAANEELETLFSRSFRLSLIRIFPYTAADISSKLTNNQRDKLQKISLTNFIK
jgi:hypothetical protein